MVKLTDIKINTQSKLQSALRYAILAPSGHNTQPWRFVLDEDKVHLYGDRSRRLPVADPQDRELTISCGAALFNLCVAMEHLGYTPDVEMFPDPNNTDWLASIGLGEPVMSSELNERLFAAIVQRHTYRLPFEPKSIPESFIRQLETAVETFPVADVETFHGTSLHGTWLYVIDTERQQVAELIAEGDRLQMADPHFRRELSQWIYYRGRKTQDGIPVYAFGMSEKLDFIAPLFAQFLAIFDLGKMQGEKDGKLALNAPLLVVIGTEEDTPKDWLNAGVALTRVLLLACSQGIQASFLNQPIQVSKVRNRLKEVMKMSGFPQLLLRLGYTKGGKSTPRRYGVNR